MKIRILFLTGCIGICVLTGCGVGENGASGADVDNAEAMGGDVGSLSAGDADKAVTEKGEEIEAPEKINDEKRQSACRTYMNFVDTLSEDTYCAFVDQGQRYPFLFVTDNVFDDRLGHTTAYEAEAYYYNGEELVNVGKFVSGGEQYPIQATKEGIFFGSGHAWYEWVYNARAGEYQLEAGVEDDIARETEGTNCYRYRNERWKKVPFSEFKDYFSNAVNANQVLTFQSKEEFKENNPYTE